jgi:hypothetical protein
MVHKTGFASIARIRHMGSYAFLSVDGRPLFSFRDEVDPTFMLLFTADDLHRVSRRGSDRPDSGREADEVYEAAEFVVNSIGLRDRLDVLGITSVRAERVLDTELQEASARLSSWLGDERMQGIANEMRDELATLAGLTYQEWKNRVVRAIGSGERIWDKREIGSLGWLMSQWTTLTHVWSFARPRMRSLTASFNST